MESTNTMKRGRIQENTKGQATGFVLLGIIILAIVILVFYLRGQFYFGPLAPRGIDERFDAITDHISTCVGDIAPDYIERIGLQGGHLKTPVDTYRLREDTTISYLCYNIEESPTCYNRLLTRGDMETELNDAIKQSLSTCLSLQKFRGGGIDLDVGTLDVLTDIGDDTVIVTVQLPITLQKGDQVSTETTFVKRLNYPLGRLYDVSQDIIDVETEFGEFEQSSYMIAHKGQYIIEKQKPYPDKLYILSMKDDSYIFQFFVQGEPLT
jgi:hypothetical protein